MTTNTQSLYSELLSLTRQASVLSHIHDLVNWDTDVMMPVGENDMRSLQAELLGRLGHRYATDARIGELLTRIARGELTEAQLANVREIERDYNRERRIPEDLAAEIARVSPVSLAVWKEAKAQNDFKKFLPYLTTMLELVRARARAIRPGRTTYDTLLDEYEPGATVTSYQTLFSSYTATIPSLVKEIANRGGPSKKQKRLLDAKVPADVQAGYLKQLATYVGYDTSRGRIDQCVHPMTTNSGRITYGVDEQWVLAIFSVLHEVGHAKYQHGLPQEHFGSPLGEARSLGVHESQSRLWENHVGKSRAFWDGQYEELKKTYRPLLTRSRVTKEDFYKLINVVEPSLIRCDADELTYGLHVVLRFEIEQGLFSGGIAPNEVPSVWNARMRELLGVVPQSDTEGCLQDVHWADGLFGYFPTYLLGSMISAQLWDAMERTVSYDMSALIRLSNFSEIHRWLTENIYRHGRRYSTSELIERATGSPPSAKAYISYLTKKYSELYNVR